MAEAIIDEIIRNGITDEQEIYEKLLEKIPYNKNLFFFSLNNVRRIKKYDLSS